MIFAWVIMILFIIPVFTGQVVNIGNITGFSCGLLLYFLIRDPSLIKKPWIIILLILLCLCFILAGFLTYRMVNVLKRKPEGDETLIILGCEIIGEKPSLMQVERLNAALRYLNQYPDTDVICSGGQGKKEKISEAYAMKKWLIQKGIDPKRIYLEDRSETTAQNLQYSKKIISDEGLNPRTALCSNEFHLYRAVRMAKGLGMECKTVSAPTAWWLLPTFHVRELYAILYYELKAKLS